MFVFILCAVSWSIFFYALVYLLPQRADTGRCNAVLFYGK